jgi:hypothetical protein
MESHLLRFQRGSTAARLGHHIVVPFEHPGVTATPGFEYRIGQPFVRLAHKDLSVLEVEKSL